MQQSYDGITSGIHSLFDQELSEFMRPAYEKYVKRYEAQKRAEQQAYELNEAMKQEAEKPQERDGIVLKLPTDSPQRPPARKRQPA